MGFGSKVAIGKDVILIGERDVYTKEISGFGLNDISINPVWSPFSGYIILYKGPISCVFVYLVLIK